ncbi:hypothetical protein WMY93_015692 [Mugilogobius chulae]|uniref:Myb/SANT-like DNA-binding domain-containing protein n=1 Tax=Mugilogobius chulae TaxID=88201 RepID=A0AAW0P244_9GOBI
MTAAAKGTHYWTDEETAFMLTQLKELNILRCLDGRKKRNGEVFKRVAGELASAGYVRTAEQIRVRWKHVKRLYFAVKRNNGTSGHSRAEFPHQDILEELLSERPVSRAADYGVSVGFETSADPPESDPSTTESESLSPRRSSEPDSIDEAGGAELSLPPRETSTPNITCMPRGFMISQTPKKRHGTAALDTYMDRLEAMHRANAVRQEVYAERIERRYQENREALMTIAQSHQQMVNLLTHLLLRPPVPSQQSFMAQHEVPLQHRPSHVSQATQDWPTYQSL